MKNVKSFLKSYLKTKCFKVFNFFFFVLQAWKEP